MSSHFWSCTNSKRHDNVFKWTCAPFFPIILHVSLVILINKYHAIIMKASWSSLLINSSLWQLCLMTVVKSVKILPNTIFSYYFEFSVFSKKWVNYKWQNHFKTFSWNIPPPWVCWVKNTLSQKTESSWKLKIQQ